jgi:hypothetical protein
MCVARLIPLTVLDRGEKYLTNAALVVAGTKTRRRQGRSVCMDKATLEYEGDSFLLNIGNHLHNDAASHPTGRNHQIVGLLITFTMNPSTSQPGI